MVADLEERIAFELGALPSSVRNDVLLLLTELVTNAPRHAYAGADRPVWFEIRYGH
jgi:anti-sigma regulatory factor (Ser/Thr protein kinase)